MLHYYLRLIQVDVALFQVSASTFSAAGTASGQAGTSKTIPSQTFSAIAFSLAGYSFLMSPPTLITNHHAGMARAKPNGKANHGLTLPGSVPRTVLIVTARRCPNPMMPITNP
jgi:hypothetical protein